jgi:hypothetical protein
MAVSGKLRLWHGTGTHLSPHLQFFSHVPKVLTVLGRGMVPAQVENIPGPALALFLFPKSFPQCPDPDPRHPQWEGMSGPRQGTDRSRLWSSVVLGPLRA